MAKFRRVGSVLPEDWKFRSEKKKETSMPKKSVALVAAQTRITELEQQLEVSRIAIEERDLMIAQVDRTMDGLDNQLYAANARIAMQDLLVQGIKASNVKFQRRYYGLALKHDRYVRRSRQKRYKLKELIEELEDQLEVCITDLAEYRGQFWANMAKLFVLEHNNETLSHGYHEVSQQLNMCAPMRKELKDLKQAMSNSNFLLGCFLLAAVAEDHVLSPQVLEEIQSRIKLLLKRIDERMDDEVTLSFSSGGGIRILHHAIEQTLSVNFDSRSGKDSFSMDISRKVASESLTI
ncbi:MAG: hypothetical protein M3Q44_07295 [bacterium]|nr:hypothetical protein [bacterium]